MNSPHDMAFTRNYSIVNDFPRNRLGIIPRYGNGDEIKWFACQHTYVLHWLNAYETEVDEQSGLANKIVLDGYFMRNADVFTTVLMGRGTLDFHKMAPQLYRWTFDLVTGELHEQAMDDRVLEFGMFNQQWAGKKYRYAYSVVPNHEEFLFTGLVKHDLETGQSQTLMFGDGRFGSESPVAPKVDAKDEDDAYLVSFVTDLNKDRSECIIVDAKRLQDGPVATILLPHRISSGTHSCWAGDALTKVVKLPDAAQNAPAATAKL
jgi:carotenoid cleavage dioxygenase